MRALQATADNMGDSLRNESFQSSYRAKVGARAEKKWMILGIKTEIRRHH